MKNDISKLKEKIITECHAWSVGYLNEMLDKLLSSQKQEILGRVRERVEGMREGMRGGYVDIVKIGGECNTGPLSWTKGHYQALSDVLSFLKELEEEREEK